MKIERPNQVWAMDITYIPMARGFVYLTAVVDWFSRRVLALRLSITLEVEFCVEAVEEALVRYGAPEVFNTDSQFTSVAFPGLLKAKPFGTCVNRGLSEGPRAYLPHRRDHWVSSRAVVLRAGAEQPHDYMQARY